VTDVCESVTVLTAAPRTFADYLRQARTAAGLRQTDLAARAGISVNAIIKYETNVRRPTTESAAKLADALGLEGQRRDELFQFAHPDSAPDQISQLLAVLDGLAARLGEVEDRLARLERPSGRPRRQA
jgi:transcriptional regulator with XRE-family HTH domain